MPAPDKVHQAKFSRPIIVYNNKNFAIGYGTYGKFPHSLGMRWNNGDNDKVGYPKLFKNPVWLHVPAELAYPILVGLLPWSTGKKRTAILGILKKLNDAGLPRA